MSSGRWLGREARAAATTQLEVTVHWGQRSLWLTGAGAMVKAKGRFLFL